MGEGGSFQLFYKNTLQKRNDFWHINYSNQLVLFWKGTVHYPYYSFYKNSCILHSLFRIKMCIFGYRVLFRKFLLSYNIFVSRSIFFFIKKIKLLIITKSSCCKMATLYYGFLEQQLWLLQQCLGNGTLLHDSLVMVRNTFFTAKLSKIQQNYGTKKSFQIKQAI